MKHGSSGSGREASLEVSRTSITRSPSKRFFGVTCCKTLPPWRPLRVPGAPLASVRHFLSCPGRVRQPEERDSPNAHGAECLDYASHENTMWTAEDCANARAGSVRPLHARNCGDGRPRILEQARGAASHRMAGERMWLWRLVQQRLQTGRPRAGHLSHGLHSHPSVSGPKSMSAPAIDSSLQGEQYPSDHKGPGPAGLPSDAWLEVISWEPRIFVYHNFLSEEECDELVAKVHVMGCDIVLTLPGACSCAQPPSRRASSSAGQAAAGSVRGGGQ